VEKAAPRTNLGVLLLEFLEYYGCSFDFRNYGIDVKEKRLVHKRVTA
jgi:DNA polymerase sigma